MKNLNIIGVHQFLGEEGHKETTYRGNSLNMGAWTICRGTWQKRGKRVFLRGEGGVIPRRTIWLNSLVHAGT